MSIQPPRIACGGDDITTNTMTAIEVKKKRAYKRKDRGGDTTVTSTTLVKKRKDCGGDTTNTPTVTETKKKRPYRRKHCGGDTTNTSTTVMETKKKRAYKRKDCGGDTTNTPTTVMETKKKGPHRRNKYLPHDLIMEEICTKLPVRTLLTSALVSKLWYDSIHNDHKRLTYSHFLQSQKQPHVILSLLNVRDGLLMMGKPRNVCHFFKFTSGLMPDHENALRFDKFRGGGLVGSNTWELVGYCHGLPCMAQVGRHSTDYVILDPNRKDFLCIHPARIGKTNRIICHGFGFDPSANEYKLVSVFRTIQKELNAVVFTLGAKSWRNVTAINTPISGHSGRPITRIRAPTGSDKSASFCTTSSSSSSSACLVWKTITTLGGAGAGANDIQHGNSNAINNEMEMLLSFNLRDEKFQFIQLPAKSTTDDEQQKHLFVDYPHLLEFKGSPCIARIERKSGDGSDYPHRCRDDHKGSSSCCCCCCKVHLYLLKDNVKQVWVKEESFDVRINSTPSWSRKLAPEPCCFCSGSTAIPPTRIFSFSDQMLLYWLNGKCLQVYNLRSEKLQLVQPFNFQDDILFHAKLEELRRNFNSGDDDIYLSNMDYQLHCHEENFLSLQTFIPEGVAGVDAGVFDKLDRMRDDSPCSGYVFIYRGSEVFYPFF